jgi:hypothetical protein
MRGTGRSLVLASILIASAALSLDAQTGMRFGNTEPTTVLTASQRSFAESYLSAITGSDIAHYKALLHPTTRACMNRDNADYFKMIFGRRAGKDTLKPRVSVEKLPEKVEMLDAMRARGWSYALRPTHAFHISLVSTGPTQSMIVAFAALDDGNWYEMLPCPSGKALDEMRQAQKRDEAQWTRARQLAASLRDPLRGEVLGLIQQGRPVSAAKRYAEATHAELTLASRVVDVLEQKKH